MCSITWCKVTNTFNLSINFLPIVHFKHCLTHLFDVDFSAKHVAVLRNPLLLGGYWSCLVMRSGLLKGHRPVGNCLERAANRKIPIDPLVRCSISMKLVLPPVSYTFPYESIFPFW